MITVRHGIWQCKIGVDHGILLPSGCDLPMRQAIAAAYKEITGIEADFIFSGWSAQLTESEQEVVTHPSRGAA